MIVTIQALESHILYAVWLYSCVLNAAGNLAIGNNKIRALGEPPQLLKNFVSFASSPKHTISIEFSPNGCLHLLTSMEGPLLPSTHTYTWQRATTTPRKKKTGVKQPLRHEGETEFLLGAVLGG